jgi:phage terminase large subunit-like protein
MLDPHSGTMLVVGTMLHFDSLLARLLGDKYGKPYIRRLWKAIMGGQSLWPARFPMERLARLKTILTARAWASEMENSPIDETARKFRPEWVQWYRWSDMSVRSGVLYFRGQPLRICAGVDQAIEEKEDVGSDESAIVVVGVTPDRKVIVLHIWHERVDFPSQVNQVLQIKDDWRVVLMGMEKPAYQRALAQQVFIQSRRRFSGIRQLPNTAPKYERISATSVALQRGAVYFRAAEDCTCGEHTAHGSRNGVHTDECHFEASNTWDEFEKVRLHENTVDFYQNMMRFPMEAHDDMPDAFTNAMQVVVGRRGFETYF